MFINFDKVYFYIKYKTTREKKGYMAFIKLKTLSIKTIITLNKLKWKWGSHEVPTLHKELHSIIIKKGRTSFPWR